jgi:hypothetical protein
MLTFHLSSLSEKSQWLIFALSLIVVFAALTAAIYFFTIRGLPELYADQIGYDYINYFRPAVSRILEGQSPYGNGVFNPPWALLIYVPLSFVSSGLASSTLITMALFGFWFVGYRLGGKPWQLALMITSPYFFNSAFSGNLDWVTALAFILPARWGLFAAVIKPQLSIGLIIFWLVEAFRSGRLKLVITTFAPVSIAYGLSLAVYGLYPLTSGSLLDQWWNISNFPYSAWLGVALLIFSIRKQEKPAAIASGLFLSPYVSSNHLTAGILTLLRYPAEFSAAILVTWLWWIYQLVKTYLL